jgi:RNA polymerase sigma-70 factor, ECF subfamily
MMVAMASDALRPLLEAAREGDDVAVRELVRRTQPAVWRLCAALGSPGEEDDRVCADHVRRRVRQRRLVDRISRAAAASEPPSLDGLTDLLAGLSDERREAFVLTQVVGLSYDDAAAVAGCPIGTIRSRVARARADLLVALRAADAV